MKRIKPRLALLIMSVFFMALALHMGCSGDSSKAPEATTSDGTEILPPEETPPSDGTTSPADETPPPAETTPEKYSVLKKITLYSLLDNPDSEYLHYDFKYDDDGFLNEVILNYKMDDKLLTLAEKYTYDLSGNVSSVTFDCASPLYVETYGINKSIVNNDMHIARFEHSYYDDGRLRATKMMLCPTGPGGEPSPNAYVTIKYIYDTDNRHRTAKGALVENGAVPPDSELQELGTSDFNEKGWPVSYTLAYDSDAVIKKIEYSYDKDMLKDIGYKLTMDGGLMTYLSILYDRGKPTEASLIDRSTSGGSRLKVLLKTDGDNIVENDIFPADNPGLQTWKAVMTYEESTTKPKTPPFSNISILEAAPMVIIYQYEPDIYFGKWKFEFPFGLPFYQ